MDAMRKHTLTRLRVFFTPPRLTFALFMLVLLAVGAWLVEDYGVSWDEHVQLEIGLANYRFLRHGDPHLLELKDRHYGPLFEIFLVRMMDQSSTRAIYLSRHFWNFTAFWFGVLGFYLLLEGIYPRRWLPLFGAALLVFSPRIFADAFYNSKDIPFMVGVIWLAAALLYYLKGPSLKRILLAGFCSAVTIGIRLPGVYLIALTGLLIGREVLARRLSLRRAAGQGLLYLLSTAGLVFLFYPVFWHDPLAEIPKAFEIMANFPHSASVLYMGHFFSPQSLPWHYLPVWVGISTPIAYLVLMLSGAARAAGTWLKSPAALLERQSTPLLTAALWLVLPAGAVILRRSTMYDGWRQMFFIYPALVLFAVHGWDWVLRWLRQRLNRKGPSTPLVFAVLGLTFLPVLLWMAVHHPYQNLYFNRLAGADMQSVKMRFDMDYWGLTYRRGLQAILAQDPRPRINVRADNAAGEYNAAILPEEEAKRLNFVRQIEQADYFITNYRWHPQDYSYPNEIFTLRLGNAKILSVFRLR